MKCLKLTTRIQQESLVKFKKKDLKPVSDIVHIRLQQRNGRKSITTIQGLDFRLDFDKINKALKKEFCCNGCVIENADMGIIIQLQGDQRNNVLNFLLNEGIAIKSMIKIHGV